MEFVFVEEQPMAGHERRVGPGTVVGRAGADVALNDPEVSRKHAAFRQVDAGVGVEDLGSRNGTWVNNRRVEGIVSLSDGDLVRFGNTIWRLGAAAPAAGGGGQVVAAAARPEPDPDRVPTGIRRVLPAEPAYGEATQFESPAVPHPIFGFSAARRLEATIVCYVVILATAAAVTLYLVQR